MIPPAQPHNNTANNSDAALAKKNAKPVNQTDHRSSSTGANSARPANGVQTSDAVVFNGTLSNAAPADTSHQKSHLTMPAGHVDVTA